jgi:hypothetical protein
MRALALPAFVSAALLWSLETAPAQEDAPQARVARLVPLLGSRSFEERKLASDELERLGEAAREQLEKEAQSENPEVRSRARDLLTRLKIAALWEPSRCSLQCQGERAEKVLAQLAQQSGNRLMMGDHYASFQDGPITLSAQRAPFWAVLDEVCRQTGNRVRAHYDQRKPGFVVVSGAPGKFPLAYAGPVRAKITGARRVFTEEMDHETRESEIAHSFQLNLQLTWEDRFRLVAFRTQAEVVDAITNTHVEVAPIGSGSGEWDTAIDTTRQVTMSLSLQPPPTSAKQFDVLRLKWGLIAVGDMASLDVTDIHAKGPHVQDDLQLSLPELEELGNGRFKMTLLVNRDLVVPEPRSVLFHENDFDLLDTEGRPLLKIINGTPRMTEEGLRIQVTFTQESTSTEPKTLRFTYPRIRSQRNLEITFRDVPLPAARPE